MLHEQTGACRPWEHPCFQKPHPRDTKEVCKYPKRCFPAASQPKRQIHSSRQTRQYPVKTRSRNFTCTGGIKLDEVAPAGPDGWHWRQPKSFQPYEQHDSHSIDHASDVRATPDVRSTSMRPSKAAQMLKSKTAEIKAAAKSLFAHRAITPPQLDHGMYNSQSFTGDGVARAFGGNLISPT